MQLDAGRLVVGGAGELGQAWRSCGCRSHRTLPASLPPERPLRGATSAARACRLAPRRCAETWPRRGRRRASAPPSLRALAACRSRQARAARRRAQSPGRRGPAAHPASHCSTASTSRASRAGPMPRPIGCDAIANDDPGCTARTSRRHRQERATRPRPASAAAHFRRRADRQIEHQMGRAGGDLLGQHRRDHLSFGVEVERPLDADEDVVGRAQLDRAAPDYASALALDHRRMPAVSRSTGAMVSIASAVPAGDVIARDDVFGMVSPSAATIATMIGVVRLPGRPPTECLSTTTSGRPSTADHPPRPSPWSAQGSPCGRAACVAQAVMKDDRSMSEYLPSTISAMMAMQRGFVRDACP